MDEVLADRTATACIQKMDFFPTPKQFIEQFRLVKASMGALTGKKIQDEPVQDNQLSVELHRRLSEMFPGNLMKGFQHIAQIKKTASNIDWENLPAKVWCQKMIEHLD